MGDPRQAKKSRDNFTETVRDRLAAEVGHRCSLPDCNAPTIGPNSTEPRGFSNSGVAAHISAAAAGGPRYDPSLTVAERSGHENGIHCCAKHSRIVDNDPTAYTVQQLRAWKAEAIDLQRRAHSTGDIDPNGRIKLARATRHDVASRVMKASLRCRAAILTGLVVADQAKNIRRVSSAPTPVIKGYIEKWTEELTRALDEANEVLMDARIQWGIKNGVPAGLDGLASLMGNLEEWRLKFIDNVQRIVNIPHTPRANFGPCDWTAVFNGDLAQRELLKRAIDVDSAKVEAWAEEFIVSRNS
jgi:hypothetical protein